MTATVTDQVTSVQTATKTETQTDRITMTDTVTRVEPTTVVSVWVQTETKDNVSIHRHKITCEILIDFEFQTQTVLNTITSTIVQDRTIVETSTFLSTATATATEVQRVLETGLSDCLGKVRNPYLEVFTSPANNPIVQVYLVPEPR